ncbi:MAG: hydroxymethylglutaryl-CoA lyase [Myxococcaceae bacterium]
MISWGSLPKSVNIYEVGLRDGLQNEARSVPTQEKVRVGQALLAAGIRRLEVTSFVPPRWIPQLSDAEGVAKHFVASPDASISALVPNLYGLERARASAVRDIAVFLSASESHSKKNINKSIAEATATVGEVARAALAEGFRVRGYISVAWGCPFEGAVPVTRVVELVQRMRDFGLYEISLGDTIGVGTPKQTSELLSEVLKQRPASGLALHLHDTRGTALANVLVGLLMGITTFDTSIGGLGGCPYAPGAAGNLPTEDLVYMLHGMGVSTGIDLPKLVQAGEIAQDVIGRRLPGKYLQAALGERDRAARKKS